MSERDEDWGPWIDHDGRGCPIPVRTVVRVMTNCGAEHVLSVLPHEVSPPPGNTTRWHWAEWNGDLLRTYEYVLRYRIRKPRGLTVLEELVQNLPAPEREEVDA